MIELSASRIGTLGLALGSAVCCASAFATPVENLPGRWAGVGNVQMSNGASEQMRCIVTYRVASGNVRQNLRCASQGYRIDAIAKLTVANGRVSGDWEERTWSKTGSISGQVIDGGFMLKIAGADFTAAMAVNLSDCRQSISITPQGFDISRISMTLGKC
ncbi:MAG: hypothetical protein AB7O43_21125 [Hyphomicrobiaceae bacterium]